LVASGAMAKRSVTAKSEPKAQVLVERAKVPTERPGQPGGRRDTNRKERIKGLTDAAVDLFLQRGIEVVTIEDITVEAGVAKGSFYRYFDDKTALVESIFAPIFDAVQQAFDDSAAAAARATTPTELIESYDILAQGLVTIILHHGDSVLLYLQENRGSMVGARAPVIRLARLLSQKAIEHTMQARRHGLLRPFPAELSTLTVIGAAERLLYAVLSGQLEGEPLEVPGALISLILDGIRVRPGEGDAPDALSSLFTGAG
jgi:AcrR family transcriptional regulator